MKQPSPIPVYTETDKQLHMELRYQLREKQKLLKEIDYQQAKGTIDTVEHTKVQLQIIMEYEEIRKQLVAITK